LKHQQIPEVAVIILNYNGKHWLEKFLPSVLAHTPPTLAKIWVADNGSTDGSLEMIKNKFSGVNTLRMRENFGFAGGYNHAIQNIPCKYVLLLNSDVEVKEGWIEPLYYTLQRDHTIAACQPKLLDYNDPLKFEYAGAGGGILDKYGYPFCRGRIFDKIENDSGQYNDEIEVFWATGACMMVNKKLFQLVGGFDKNFFAHMEEIDLCWRFKNLGYKIKYVPSSKVFHIGGGTLNAQNPHKTFLNYRNNRLMLFKNLEAGQALQVNLIRNLLDLLSLVQVLLKFKFKDAGAIIKAQFAYRKMMLKALEDKQKFKEIQQKHKIGPPNTKGLYPKSIVFSFFIRQKKKFTNLSW
jgi:GT2 family glycosyltransferase